MANNIASMNIIRNTGNSNMWYFRPTKMFNHNNSLLSLAAQRVILEMKHVSLICYLEIPDILKHELMDYASKRNLTYCNYGYNMADVSLRILFPLDNYLKLDTTYYDWFVRLIMFDINIHLLQCKPYYHVLHYYFIDDNFKEYNMCLFCYESYRIFSKCASKCRRMIHHTETASQFNTKAAYAVENSWCQMCKVVPTIEIKNPAECKSMFGTFLHTCSCSTTLECLDCFENNRSEFKFIFDCKQPNLDFNRHVKPRPKEHLPGLWV